jgi:hypothetical protein
MPEDKTLKPHTYKQGSSTVSKRYFLEAYNLGDQDAGEILQEHFGIALIKNQS